MIVDFKSIHPEAKLWVFPSSRKFYKDEVPEITAALEDFLNHWENQGLPVNCSYLLKYDRFIIVTADDTEEPLSLEAHDALTSLILTLEKKYAVLLLDKINVCYKQGDFVQYKDILDFKKMMKAKGVSQKTVVFNNMITVKDELATNWEINIMDSWLSRFL